MFAKQIGAREPVVKRLAKPRWAWLYADVASSDRWKSEGEDDPESEAAGVSTPPRILGLPAADWDGTVRYYQDPSTERVQEHLALTAWINPTGIVGTDRFIIGKYGAGPTGLRWYLRNTNGQQYCVFQTAGGTAVFIEGSTTVMEDEWQQVAIVYDPTTGYCRSYRNGIQTNETEVIVGGGAVVDSSVDLRIGCSQATSVFRGGIGLLGSLTEEILTDSEQYIRELYEEQRHIFGV